jgi:acyl-CoA dehydrogenase
MAACGSMAAACGDGKSGCHSRCRRGGADNRGSGEAGVLIAIAKTRVGEAATLASEIAHQLHGAIGFTKKYSLQLSTRRLWSWRDAFGGDTEWAACVGAYVCARGAAALWPMLTDD